MKSSPDGYPRNVNVTGTPAAEEVVRKVAGSGREDLVMILGTGCCDSTAPFLYDRYERSPDAVEVGSIAGVPVFADGWLAGLYAGAGRLEVDVEEGVVNDSFSLESGLDCRFTLRAPTGPRAVGA